MFYFCRTTSENFKKNHDFAYFDSSQAATAAESVQHIEGVDAS